MVDYIPSAFYLILALWGVVDGILTLMGKQDDCISCLNKPDAEQYNVKRVRLVRALQEFAWAILFVALAFAYKYTMGAWIITGSAFLALVVLFFLKKTWVKHN